MCLTLCVYVGSKNDAFVLMTKADEKLSLFLEQYMTVKLFPRPNNNLEDEPYQKASDKLQCLCDPPRGSNIFKKGDSWDELSKEIIETKGESLQIKTVSVHDSISFPTWTSLFYWQDVQWCVVVKELENLLCCGS